MRPVADGRRAASRTSTTLSLSIGDARRSSDPCRRRCRPRRSTDAIESLLGEPSRRYCANQGASVTVPHKRRDLDAGAWRRPVAVAPHAPAQLEAGLAPPPRTRRSTPPSRLGTKRREQRARRAARRRPRSGSGRRGRRRRRARLRLPRRSGGPLRGRPPISRAPRSPCDRPGECGDGASDRGDALEHATRRACCSGKSRSKVSSRASITLTLACDVIPA